MALLDFLTNDPDQQKALTQGLLSAAFGAMAGRGTRLQALGQGGLAGLVGYGNAVESQQQAKDKAALMQRQAMQDQLLQGQIQGMQRQQKIADLPAQFMRAPTLPATMDNRDVGQPGEAPLTPTFDQAGYLNALRGLDFNQYLQTANALAPKAPQYKEVGGSLVKIGPDDTVSEAYRAPEKPEALPTDVRTFQYAQQNPEFDRWNRDNKRAGASSVNVPVNLGQKGLDNTLKLRGDFRSEPVYKAHQEMQSAYAQIQQSLKQASPAGDLAGATKIMKLLDPGSVVRESELGMAMAASGLLDRVQNYASNVLNGTKLTPTQRKDFQTLADALYQESAKQYEGKRLEYRGIVERNGLNEADVLGPPATAPKGSTAPKTAPMKGVVQDGYRFKGGDPADQKNWEKL